jgi:hypothetical protein
MAAFETDTQTRTPGRDGTHATAATIHPAIGRTVEVHGPAVGVACDTLPPLRRGAPIHDGGAPLSIPVSEPALVPLPPLSRPAYMEQAIDHLDETVQHLTLRRNALHQERFVEEIELMLAAAMVSQAQLAGAGPMARHAASQETRR